MTSNALPMTCHMLYMLSSMAGCFVFNVSQWVHGTPSGCTQLITPGTDNNFQYLTKRPPHLMRWNSMEKLVISVSKMINNYCIYSDIWGINFNHDFFIPVCGSLAFQQLSWLGQVADASASAWSIQTLVSRWDLEEWSQCNRAHSPWWTASHFCNPRGCRTQS